MAGILTQSIGIISSGVEVVGTFTLGNDSSVVGYDDDGSGPPYGSIAGITEIDGLPIVVAISSGSADFQMNLSTGADPGQSHFTSITIQDGAGTPILFETSAVSSYVHSVDTAFWVWGDGTSRLWEVADIGEMKTFTIVV